MYYGTPEKDDDNLRPIKCDVLGIFGTKDASIPNNGRYQWTVPNHQSDQVRLAVARISHQDETGIVTSAELGESGTFRINSTLDVGPVAQTPDARW